MVLMSSDLDFVPGRWDRILDRTSWDLDIPNPDARKLDVYLLDPLSGTLVSVCLFHNCTWC